MCECVCTCPAVCAHWGRWSLWSPAASSSVLVPTCVPETPTRTDTHRYLHIHSFTVSRWIKCIKNGLICLCCYCQSSDYTWKENDSNCSCQRKTSFVKVRNTSVTWLVCEMTNVTVTFVFVLSLVFLTCRERQVSLQTWQWSPPVCLSAVLSVCPNSRLPLLCWMVTFSDPTLCSYTHTHTLMLLYLTQHNNIED